MKKSWHIISYSTHIYYLWQYIHINEHSAKKSNGMGHDLHCNEKETLMCGAQINKPDHYLSTYDCQELWSIWHKWQKLSYLRK